MDMNISNICARIMTEVSDSIRKHGDWSDYDVDRMAKAVYGELMEMGEAELRKDVTGPHGMIREAIQTCACLVKMIAQMEAGNVKW